MGWNRISGTGASPVSHAQDAHATIKLDRGLILDCLPIPGAELTVEQSTDS